MITIWIAICIYAFLLKSEIEFFILAAVVGLVMGGIQSLSRATFSKIIPKNTVDTASFYSFYDVTYNLSIVIGLFVYGYIEQISGSMRNSTLVLAIFFIIGMILIARVKIKHANAQSTRI